MSDDTVCTALISIGLCVGDPISVYLTPAALVVSMQMSLAIVV